MAYPEIELISSGDNNIFYNYKEKSSQKIRELMPPQVSPILEAMV